MISKTLEEGKKWRMILLILFVYISIACIDKEKSPSSQFYSEEETYVYLCDSPGGKKYHFKETCRGLSRCKADIIKVSLEQAKKRGKTLCGWED